jgi:predicted RNase H-like nuclease
VGEFDVAPRVGDQAGQRPPDRLVRRDTDQRGTGIVPVAHDAVAVGAVDGDVRRQLDRRGELVQQLERSQTWGLRFAGWRITPLMVVH